MLTGAGRVRRVAVAACGAAVLLTADAGAAVQRIQVTPATVERGDTLEVVGREWVLFESCRPRVEVSIVRAGASRVRMFVARLDQSPTFRRSWRLRGSLFRQDLLAPGRWRVVAEQQCDSGLDGTIFYLRASRTIRIR